MTDQQDSFAHPDPADWDEAQPGPPGSDEPSGLFTPLRCCGCLLLLVVLFGFGAKLAFDSALSTMFPDEGLELPPVETTPAERSALELRVRETVESGAPLTPLTTRELTILLDGWVSEFPYFEPGTGRFHCEPTEDGLLRIRCTGQLTSDMPMVGGRHVNLELDGTVEIRDGAVQSARIARFGVGGHTQEEPSDDEESLAFFERLLSGRDVSPEVSRELEAGVSRIELFRFDGERIELKLRPPEPPPAEGAGPTTEGEAGPGALPGGESSPGEAGAGGG